MGKLIVVIIVIVIGVRFYMGNTDVANKAATGLVAATVETATDIKNVAVAGAAIAKPHIDSAIKAVDSAIAEQSTKAAKTAAK